MAEQKFKVPTEVIELPSKGMLYDKENPLSTGSVEMKYMTAREEDILTNVNLLRQGIAIEQVLKSLIITPINYEDLLIGDRNGLLIAARILAYGSEYTFSYKYPQTSQEEQITYDLQNLDHKVVDYSVFDHNNEFEFELPHTKNKVTFKLLTVGDDKKIDEEIKGLKKAIKVDVGALSMRLKHQITSVNGEYSTKAVREFIDGGYLLSRDSIELRKYIDRISPDMNMKATFTTKAGQEVTMELPMTSEFFFPGSGI